MHYIIGRFDKYDKWDREHCVYKFEINGQMCAIKQVEVIDGLPQLPTSIEYESRPETYFVYDKLEDALSYVKLIKSLN